MWTTGVSTTALLNLINAVNFSMHLFIYDLVKIVGNTSESVWSMARGSFTSSRPGKEFQKAWKVNYLTTMFQSEIKGEVWSQWCYLTFFSFLIHQLSKNKTWNFLECKMSFTSFHMKWELIVRVKSMHSDAKVKCSWGQKSDRSSSGQILRKLL